MKKIFVISSLLFIFILASCQKTRTYKDKLQVHYENLEPQNIVAKNYADVLFSLDTAIFAEELKRIQEEYKIFLEGNLDDYNAVNYLKSFATDTFCLRINNMVQERFSDVTKLNKDIRSVYQMFNYYYPEIKIPNDTYYYISGIDYGMPSVMIHPYGVLISLDFYLGNNDKTYDYVGMPRFRSVRCHPSYITRDLAQTIYKDYIYNQYNQKDVLTDMVNVGKQLYFIEAMNPALPDSVLMGYSSKQINWAEQYESDVWAAIVGNDMLYSNDLNVFRTLFGDAPFTQAFSNDAPARLGEYVGLQIIRSYMTNNDISLRELMKNNDVQQIFQASQYKPK